MDNIFYTLITGASEGFGKALAIECASRNMHLVLVALPGSGLQLLGPYLKETFGIQVIVIEKDLCKEDGCLQVYQEVQRTGVQVNMLLNNAGIG
ncbi:MAG TPA: SDR family NAD(P)-dependent oxidoreductase, partial [Flavitalea sp.]|nr:SDR family NAD(P)-dependent oxidoreductase [Flavitalea sp.]